MRWCSGGSFQHGWLLTVTLPCGRHAGHGRGIAAPAARQGAAEAEREGVRGGDGQGPRGAGGCEAHPGAVHRLLGAVSGGKRIKRAISASGSIIFARVEDS